MYQIKISKTVDNAIRRIDLLNLCNIDTALEHFYVDQLLHDIDILNNSTEYLLHEFEYGDYSSEESETIHEYINIGYDLLEKYNSRYANRFNW